VAQNDSPDRPCEVPDRENGERQNQGNQRIGSRKESRGNILRKNAINDEIVEFERSAQTGEDDRLPLRGSE
jgi:hypothetical protein